MRHQRHASFRRHFFETLRAAATASYACTDTRTHGRTDGHAPERNDSDDETNYVGALLFLVHPSQHRHHLQVARAPPSPRQPSATLNLNLYDRTPRGVRAGAANAGRTPVEKRERRHTCVSHVCFTRLPNMRTRCPSVFSFPPILPPRSLT